MSTYFIVVAKYCVCKHQLTMLLLPTITGIALMLIGLSTMGTSIFSLIPPALRELIGEQNVTSGMGLQMIFQACGFIGSSFIAGKM